MTAPFPTAWSAPRSAIDQFVSLWMMPLQVSLDLMESSTDMMLSGLPRAKMATERTAEATQEIFRAAEEQAAKIDDLPNDTMPTPAALIA